MDKGGDENLCQKLNSIFVLEDLTDVTFNTTKNRKQKNRY